MLVLSRKPGEEIVIDLSQFIDNILNKTGMSEEVKVLFVNKLKEEYGEHCLLIKVLNSEIQNNKVRIGISAITEILVHRMEIFVNNARSS